MVEAVGRKLRHRHPNMNRIVVAAFMGGGGLG
jgi:hypothetical protein